MEWLNIFIAKFSLSVGGAIAISLFMTALYHGAGEGGRKLIEDTFNNIRKGL